VCALDLNNRRQVRTPPTRSRRFALLAVVIAGLAAVGALVLGVLSPERPALPAAPTFMGDDRLLLSGDAREVADALGAMKALGADVVRVPARWSAIAPRHRRQFAWARLDLVARLAHRRGLLVMVELIGPPPRGPIDTQRFREFAAAVASRYSGRFRGIPAAAAFAIWDEPNGAGGLTPSAYRELVAAAYPAIKREAPSSLVLVGNTAPAGRVDPVVFLRRLACALPDLGCARFRKLPGDGWGHHPGRDGGDLRPLARELGALRARGRLAGPVAVYVTDHGAPASAGLYRQARELGEAEYRAWRSPGARGFAQSPLRDPATPTAGAAGPGLELADGAPKPAFGAFGHPLVVHQTGSRQVTVWGHVRPGSGRRRFRVAVRDLDGTWRALPTFNRPRRTDAHGYFLIDARTAPGGLLLDPAATFRLELLERDGWRPAGMPILGASPAPADVRTAAGSRPR
jgi:hypothetical protein